jgi:molecular chaperone DnaK
MQIGPGQKPRPFVAAPVPDRPVPEPDADLPARPEVRPATLALGPQDLSPLTRPPVPPERNAPPPMPPARPPDRDKIQAALFGGKPKPFADAMPLPVEPAAPVAAAPFDAAFASGTATTARTPAWDRQPAGGAWGGPPAPTSQPVDWSGPAQSAPLAGLPEPSATSPSDGFGFPLGAPQVSPQALSPRQPSVAMPDRPAPLLMDVTPLALGLETAGGYVQHLVNRNAPIPTEKTRVFSTARDDQTDVEVRICQGDSNLYKDNQALGAITLTGLRKARRGEIRIEVTFMIDASGILDVKATDLDTRRAQALRIALRGGIDQAEVDQMRQRQERELFPAQR